MLLQYHVTLSTRHAQQLIWSRYDIHGVAGKNIPMDLHMEHLDRIAKEAIKGLGANKTHKTICHIGKALGTISPLCSDNFDKECGVADVSGLHTKPTIEKYVIIVVQLLQQSEVFRQKTDRKHEAFPRVHTNFLT